MCSGNSAHSTTPMLLAANSAVYTPHEPTLFLIKPPKLLQAQCAPSIWIKLGS